MFKQGFFYNHNVSDCKKTIEFYTEKLGFKLIYFDENKRDAMVTTNSKDCSIGFAEAQPITVTSTCIAFEVEDINHAVQALQQKGIEFKDGIIEVPGAVKLAGFRDPDGYKLLLSEKMS